MLPATDGDSDDANAADPTADHSAAPDIVEAAAPLRGARSRSDDALRGCEIRTPPARRHRLTVATNTNPTAAAGAVQRSRARGPLPVRGLPAVLVAAGICGCSGVQSTLDPAGPSAQAIADIWWVMFWGACAVFVLVVSLLLFSLSRFSNRLRRPALLVAGGGLLLPITALVGLLVYGTLTGRQVIALGQPSERVVEVIGRQWQWEFVYLDADERPVARSTNTLALPLDTLVEFRITSEDVIHSFWIPRLGGKRDAIPGRVNTLRLAADRTGPMRGQCAEFCGLAHAHMAFEVEVMPADAFDAWLLAQTADQAHAASASAPAEAAR
jgi:cytochrome c oxidase subunit 2